MIVDFDLKIELEVYQDLQFGYFWYQNIYKFWPAQSSVTFILWDYRRGRDFFLQFFITWRKEEQKSFAQIIG